MNFLYIKVIFKINYILSIGYLQRKAAWEILLKVSSGDFSDHALEKVLKNYQFDPLDIAFITELSLDA